MASVELAVAEKVVSIITDSNALDARFKSLIINSF
jgi:hypothetical protein